MRENEVQNGKIIEATMKLDREIDFKNGPNFMCHLRIQLEDGGEQRLEFKPVKVPLLMELFKVDDFRDLEGIYCKVKGVELGAPVSQIKIANILEEAFIENDFGYYGGCYFFI